MRDDPGAYRGLHQVAFPQRPRRVELGAVAKKALQLESKAVASYTEAADKIRALPDVSRSLARTGARRAAAKQRLQELT